jgi:tetratricopeptide (TPR) repeat protein
VDDWQYGVATAICHILNGGVGMRGHGMNLRRWIGRLLIGMGALMAVTATQAFGQHRQRQEPQDSSKQPDAAPAKKPAKKNADNAAQSASDQPTWDPLRAEKDLEVGQYYMHKGDLDAAIDRFQDATTAKPGYAIPFRYLGEAQEKKGLKKQAIKSYQRYLDIIPHADDAERVKKRIEKLYKEVEKEKK